MSIFNSFLSNLSTGLHKLADSIKPTKPEQIESKINYFPKSEPPGEIRSRKHSDGISYFWGFRDENGKKQWKYLARTEEKAIARREELSGWLTPED